MFKIIMFVKKRAEFGTDEFLACWRAHTAKVLHHQAALGIRAYTKTLPEAADTMRDTLPFAWDALGELWYDSREAFNQARATAAGQAALATLRADEATFVDLTQSVLWFGEEERVI